MTGGWICKNRALLFFFFWFFILGFIFQDGGVKSGSLKDGSGGSLGLFKERSFAGKQNTSLAAVARPRRQRGGVSGAYDNKIYIFLHHCKARVLEFPNLPINSIRFYWIFWKPEGGLWSMVRT